VGETLADPSVLKYGQDRTGNARSTHRSKDRTTLCRFEAIAKHQRYCSEVRIKDRSLERDSKAGEEYYEFC